MVFGGPVEASIGRGLSPVETVVGDPGVASNFLAQYTIRRRYMRRSGALEGYLAARTAAISVNHSTHTEISVTGVDRGGMRRTRLCALLSVVSVCHASCSSSAISMDSRFSILSTSLVGSRAVKKPGVACAGMPAGASSDGKASVAAWIAVGAASSGSNTGSLGEAPVAWRLGGGGGGGGAVVHLRWALQNTMSNRPHTCCPKFSPAFLKRLWVARTLVSYPDPDSRSCGWITSPLRGKRVW